MWLLWLLWLLLVVVVDDDDVVVDVVVAVVAVVVVFVDDDDDGDGDGDYYPPVSSHMASWEIPELNGHLKDIFIKQHFFSPLQCLNARGCYFSMRVIQYPSIEYSIPALDGIPGPTRRSSPQWGF